MMVKHLIVLLILEGGNPTSERFAMEKENFFGAKYYDQPLTHDVFDSFVGELLELLERDLL